MEDSLCAAASFSVADSLPDNDDGPVPPNPSCTPRRTYSSALETTKSCTPNATASSPEAESKSTPSINEFGRTAPVTFEARSVWGCVGDNSDWKMLADIRPQRDGPLHMSIGRPRGSYKGKRKGGGGVQLTQYLSGRQP
eukprot:Opistho-2@46582